MILNRDREAAIIHVAAGIVRHASHQRNALGERIAAGRHADVGRAEAIVTGDQALLALREYKSVHLISLRDYLERTA